MTEHWLAKYQRMVYEDGARGPDRIDCWGLCREVRYLICGKRLLPSWGHVRKTMPREFTRAYTVESEAMRVCGPEIGAIAAVFRGKICVHVGVVVELEGALAVLEMNPKKGAGWMRPHDFERQYLKVVYYNDSDIPEQA